ncbi:MAG: hypothetical protein K9L17_12225 [Clostridiales bacterium]|nr:hypothetical protein [Clostridiales bacterium]MCF8023448.1 hypothetical protein [Clostridiales bacterium]
MFCPYCNQVKKPDIRCICGTLMEDNGPVNDYYGPYSPYFNMAFESKICRHLFTCPSCGKDKIIEVELEID